MKAPTESELAQAGETLASVSAAFDAQVVGQERLRTAMLVALMTEGHLLLESLPGLAKTLASSTLAQAVQARFARIQCTPDLLPSDIIGTQLYDPRHHTFETQLGPVHANIVLLDEINRASAKTQSALLEAMQERQTSIAGQIHPLPRPFLVLATQNPIEQEGTYVLPEAQMDRFLLKEVLGYPTREQEVRVLDRIADGTLGGVPAGAAGISTSSMTEAAGISAGSMTGGSVPAGVAGISTSSMTEAAGISAGSMTGGSVPADVAGISTSSTTGGSTTGGSMTGGPAAGVGLGEVLALQALVQRVYVDEAVKRYIVDVVHATRAAPEVIGAELGGYVETGASPRGTISFFRVAQAMAVLGGRAYAVPEDVRALRHSILRHRLHLTFEALADRVPPETIIDAVFAAVPTP